MRELYRIISSIILLFFTSFAWGEEKEVVGNSWDDYKIITERNIFSRNRRPVSESVRATDAPVRTAIVKKEQSYHILRGISQQSDGFVSFFEDSRTGEITKLRTGQLIGDGKIKSMTLDYIYYVLQGKTTRVEIGMNLEGLIAGDDTFFPSGFENLEVSFDFPAAGESDGPEQTLNEDDSEILKRLKERRKKELEG